MFGSIFMENRVTTETYKKVTTESIDYNAVLSYLLPHGTISI